MVGQPVTTFVCVNWQNYLGRGVEYVNKLFNGVRQNLPNNYSFKFICCVDNPDDVFEAGITKLLLPEGVKGWWNKLYLFKAGLFPEGERIVFLDLDTIITGPLDEIVKYEGEFAVLRDFYHPERVGPGFMLWRAGFGGTIWRSYEAAGFPTDLPLGDLSWINKVFDESGYKPDILQDLFPGEIVSYKVHAVNGIPHGAKVVCFHGLPRPHEAGGWVEDLWGKGRTPFQSHIIANSGAEIVARNIAHSSALPLEWLSPTPEHDGSAVIVGGGPSLASRLGEIAARKQNGQFIIAANGAHDYLIENGITPDAAIIIDARPENASFLTKARNGIKYYLASQCDPRTYAALTGLDITVLHLNTQDVLSMIPLSDKPLALVSGGSTVGLIAISLAHTLGYRRFYLYGMDSSYQETEHHAYEQLLNAGDSVLEVEAAGRKFRAAPWMITQVQQFQELAALLSEDGCTIHVAGEGLLPHVAHEIERLSTTTETV